jgi:hypothetical protein
VGANLYFMDYDNQLVLTGEYNDVGAYKTKNVKDSYRMGAEITAGVNITKWLRWDANLVASRNKILNYHQYIDLYDDQDNWNWLGQDSVVGTTTIAFSPTLTASSLFTFDIAGFTATVQTNVVSKQYLDNTQDENAMLRAYSTTNLNLQYLLPIKKSFPSGEDLGEAPDDGCCGEHLVCERETLLQTNAKVEYYDDEELDALSGISAEDYTEEQYQMIREVFNTLQAKDVPGWVRSIQLRNIQLPLDIREEALLIVVERRKA